MPKEEIVSKLVPVFCHHGYEGASISRLSAATGLKKASLYHHFPGGKEQMAAAVLAYIDQWIEQYIFSALHSSQPASDRLAAMIQSIEQFYEGGKAPCILAVMSLGEADNLFHQQLEKSLRQWLEELTQLVESTGVNPETARIRAEDIMMLIQGALVVARVTKDTQPFKRVMAKIPQILLPESTLKHLAKD